MTFTQEIPIPSYLFAIVCGNLVEKKGNFIINSYFYEY